MNNKCPLCHEPLKVVTYQEEIGGRKETVEVDKKCSCGYHYNKAYGVVEITNDKEDT